MESDKKKGNSKSRAKGTNKKGQAVKLPNSSANKAPLRARSAAKGVDTWRAKGGAPASRSQRTAKGDSKAQAPASNRMKGGAVTLPNSNRAGKNLPREAASKLRTSVQGPRAATRPAASMLSKAGGLKAGLAGGAIYAAGDALLGPLARKAGEKIGEAARNSLGKSAKRGNQESRTDAMKRFRDDQARREANTRVRAGRLRAANPQSSTTSPTPPTRTANDAQRTRRDTQRQASGGGSATPAPRQSTSRPSQAQPTTSTGTTAKARKWEDFNTGRGTSETNNPLIKKDSWLMSKIQQREETQAKNVGPVADGGEYSASKKAAEITARRKKKEEEDKKKNTAQ